MLHFSLFRFSTQYSDTEVLFKYASENQWENVFKLLNTIPGLKEANIDKLSAMALKNMYMFSNFQQWPQVLSVGTYFPQILTNNLFTFLDKAREQKDLAAYLCLIEFRNKEFGISFPPLDSKFQTIFCAIQDGNWNDVAQLYEDDIEKTLRDAYGLTLNDYAHFHGYPKIFEYIKFGRQFRNDTTESHSTDYQVVRTRIHKKILRVGHESYHAARGEPTCPSYAAQVHWGGRHTPHYVARGRQKLRGVSYQENRDPRSKGPSHVAGEAHSGDRSSYQKKRGARLFGRQ